MAYAGIGSGGLRFGSATAGPGVLGCSSTGCACM